MFYDLDGLEGLAKWPKAQFISKVKRMNEMRLFCSVILKITDDSYNMLQSPAKSFAKEGQVVDVSDSASLRQRDS